MTKRFTGLDSHYSLDIQDRTLDFKIQGIVDMKIVLRLMLDFKIKVQHLNESHWAALMDLREWGLHPPRLSRLLLSFMNGLKKAGK